MAKTTNKTSKTSPVEILSIEQGKMPPQAVEIEEVVLGAIMLERDAIVSVIDILLPESFYKEAHQKIYKAIVDLFSEDKPIDILGVTEELKKRKELESVGGAYYIAQLTSRVLSSANIEFHARIIQQKYIQRNPSRCLSVPRQISIKKMVCPLSIDFKKQLFICLINPFKKISKK